MIEKQEVTTAKCVCGHVDYVPVEDEALLSLPGFQVDVIYKDMVEHGYACKPAHLNRVARPLAERLLKEFGPQAKIDLTASDAESSAPEDEPTGLVAS